MADKATRWRAAESTPVPAILDELNELLRIPSVSTGGGDAQALKRRGRVDVRADRGGRRRGGAGDARRRPSDGRGRAALRQGRCPDGARVRAPRRSGPGAARRLGQPALRAEPCATAASTRAAPPTTRATSCRCCTWPASWRARASCRSTCASSWRGGGGGIRARRMRWIREDERGADAALVFDSGMLNERTPAIAARHARAGGRLGRGAHRRSRRAFGVVRRHGAERGARARRTCSPRSCRTRTGACARSSRAGMLPPRPEELESWTALPPGDEVIAGVGGAAGVAARRRRVLRANRRADVARRERDQGGGAAHDRPRRGASPPDRAAGRGPECGGDRGRAGAASSARPRRRVPRCRSRSSWPSPRGFDLVAPGYSARGRGDGARLRSRAGVHPRGRHHPGARRALGARHRQRGDRLRARRRRHSTPRTRATASRASGSGEACARELYRALADLPRSR